HRGRLARVRRLQRRMGRHVQGRHPRPGEGHALGAAERGLDRGDHPHGRERRGGEAGGGGARRRRWSRPHALILDETTLEPRGPGDRPSRSRPGSRALGAQWVWTFQNGGRSVPVFASPASRPNVNAVLTAATTHHSSGDAQSGSPNSASSAATKAEPTVARTNAQVNHHRVSRRRATSTMSSDRENAKTPAIRTYPGSGSSGRSNNVTSTNRGPTAIPTPHAAQTAASKIITRLR